MNFKSCPTNASILSPRWYLERYWSVPTNFSICLCQTTRMSCDLMEEEQVLTRSWLVRLQEKGGPEYWYFKVWSRRNPLWYWNQALHCRRTGKFSRTDWPGKYFCLQERSINASRERAAAAYDSPVPPPLRRTVHFFGSRWEDTIIKRDNVITILLIDRWIENCARSEQNCKTETVSISSFHPLLLVWMSKILCENL